MPTCPRKDGRYRGGGGGRRQTAALKALDRLLTSNIEGGVAGIVPIGTTGESPTLTAEEKAKVIEFCVKKAAGKVKVIAGTGSNNTSTSLEATKAAKALGVDAVLIVNPYYSKPSQEGLYQHVKALNEVGVPIVLYNIPGRTGITMEPATIARLYNDCEQVCAVKEATGSLDIASEIASLCDITLLSGDDSLTLPLMAVGGKGVVSVLSNLAPEKVVSMVKAGLQGDFASATKQHVNLFPLFKVMFCETNPVPCKYAMSINGICEPSVRLPLVGLQQASIDKLVPVLVDKGVSTVENANKKAKSS
ncbi:4-hydroxy-tetrahydrodipicolinate synthase (HTPA synthase) [Durusdinium trenchii]|uniref:4-hydroxy-tetrahydrodipicolinate synthase n=1 Tax=Durusdinium trenchii TaxID=1381693 RepID=A0ABP0INW1_9DINO